MIAIGGVIGAGLFVGSGVVIADTGPGSFLTYALAGVLIIMMLEPDWASVAQRIDDWLGDRGL